MGAAYEIPPEINVISTKLTYRFVGTCKCRYHLCPSTSVGSVLPLPHSREGDAFLGKGLNPAGNPRRAYLRGDELSILCQQHVKDCIFWANQTCVINLGLRQARSEYFKFGRGNRNDDTAHSYTDSHSDCIERIAGSQPCSAQVYHQLSKGDVQHSELSTKKPVVNELLVLHSHDIDIGPG